MKLLKYVESRLCVSSGLGKIWVYSPQFLVNPFTQNTIVVTYVTLFIYWQKLMVVKHVFNAVISFHCNRDERRHCNSNAMYMVEIENLYASGNDMLISIF